MAVLTRAFWVKALFILCSGLSSFALAASVNDQFEVARTKVLYLLGQQQNNEAVAYVESQNDRFADTVFESEWSYLTAITYSNSGNLTRAVEQFAQLESDGYQSSNFLLEHGLVLIKQRDYPNAIEKLTLWTNQNPLFPQAEYYLALAHYESNNFAEADARLTPLVANYAQYNSPGIREDRLLYLYSATKVAQQQYAAAETSLVRLTQWPGGSVYQDSASDLLDSVRAVAESDAPFTIKLSVIGSADSNVTLAETSEGWDARGAFQADFGLNLFDPFVFSYQAFASRHIEQSEYDLFSHTIDVGASFDSVAYAPTVGYQAALNFLDGESWLNKHSLLLGVEALEINWSAGLAYLQYNDTDDELEFSFSGLWRMPEAPSFLQTLTFEAGFDWTTDDGLANKNVGLFGEAEGVNVTGPYVFIGRARLAQTFYAPSIEQESAFLISATGSAKRNWSRHWSTTLKADGFLSLAQPSAYGYNRFVLTATASWRY